MVSLRATRGSLTPGTCVRDDAQNAYNAFAVRQVVNNPCRVVFGKFCWPARSIRALGGLGQVLCHHPITALHVV